MNKSKSGKNTLKNGMLKKSIGGKITLMSICCILAAVIAAVAVMYIGSNTQNNMILANDTKTGINALEQTTESLSSDALYDVAEFVNSNTAATELNQSSQDDLGSTLALNVKGFKSSVNFMTITDASGKIMASTTDAKAGTSLTNLKDIKEAKGGFSSGCYLEIGSDAQLAIRTAKPVQSRDGKIIAIVSVGCDLSKTDVLDSLKKNTGCEFTYFLNDTRLNTTITVNGKNAAGTKASPTIAAQVIQQKKTYVGSEQIFNVPYYVQYEPMKDANGKAIGMYYAGKPLSDIYAQKNRFFLLTVLTAIIFSAVSILLFNRLSRKKITEPIRSMSKMAVSLAAGNLSGQELAVNSQDEIGLLAKSLQTMSFNLRQYIVDISQQLTAMAQGDMTVAFEMEYVGDFKPIKKALEKISGSLNETLSQIDQSAQQVSSSASQVSSGSQELAQGTVEQSGSVQELSATIEGVSQKVMETTGKVRRMTQTVANAVEDVDSSNRKVKHMLAAMNGIRQSSDQIGKIIKSIDDIAFQTNILALNAAVEAARAGEAGKGFAVVADEVRNLAAKSAEASKETAALIHDTLEKVQNGFELAEDTAKSSQQIHTKLQQLTGDMDEIDRTSASEAVAVGRIRQGIAQVSSVVQTNSAMAEESAAASEELSGQAALLREEVGKFRLRS